MYIHYSFTAAVAIMQIQTYKVVVIVVVDVALLRQHSGTVTLVALAVSVVYFRVVFFFGLVFVNRNTCWLLTYINNTVLKLREKKYKILEKRKR